MPVTITTGGPQAASGPVPAAPASPVSNQDLQDLYTGYTYLVRRGYPAQALRMALQDAGAIAPDVTRQIDLSSAYLYFDFLNDLCADARSGWSAYHADSLMEVPPGGVTVFNAVDPGQPDPSNGCLAMGYTHGHVMMGSVYNGPAQARANWLGGGIAGGTFFFYDPTQKGKLS